MIHTAQLSDAIIMLASTSMVIIFGLLYAGLVITAHIQQRHSLLSLAYCSYAALVVSVFILVTVTGLAAIWLPVVLAALVGYLLAPHAIRYLRANTHHGSIR